MIKTIKVKKKLRLDELIKYVRENQIGGGNYKEYFSDCRVYLLRINGYKLDYFLKDKTIGLQSGKYPNMPLDTTFTVEVEEEITKDTVFEAFVVITDKGVIKSINNYHNMRAVRGLLENYEVEQKIYALIDNNLELIWEAE